MHETGPQRSLTLLMSHEAAYRSFKRKVWRESFLGQEHHIANDLLSRHPSEHVFFLIHGCIPDDLRSVWQIRRYFTWWEAVFQMDSPDAVYVDVATIPNRL